MKKVDLDIKKSAKAVLVCVISHVQGASPNVLKIKCKNRVRMQKGIERLHMVKTNIESTLTQMQLQKGSFFNPF